MDYEILYQPSYALLKLDLERSEQVNAEAFKRASWWRKLFHYFMEIIPGDIMPGSEMMYVHRALPACQYK